MPGPTSAFDVPGQRATAIIEEEAEQMFDTVWERAQNILLDGTFPGSKELPPRERRGKYLSKTDARDVQALLDPDYLKKWKAGLAPQLVSPWWLAALSLPPLFGKLQQDFRRLMEQYRDG